MQGTLMNMDSFVHLQCPEHNLYVIMCINSHDGHEPFCFTMAVMLIGRLRRLFLVFAVNEQVSTTESKKSALNQIVYESRLLWQVGVVSLELALKY